MTDDERTQVIVPLKMALAKTNDAAHAADLEAALAIIRMDAEPDPPPLTNAQLRTLMDAMPIAKPKD